MRWPEPTTSLCQTDPAPPEMLFTENETNCVACIGPGRDKCRRRMSKTASTITWYRAKQTRSIPLIREPKPSARYHARHCAGRNADDSPAPDERSEHVPIPLGADFDTVFAQRAGRKRTPSMPPSRRPMFREDAKQSAAAGAGRTAVEQAVLPLCRADSGWTAIPAFRPPPPQRKQGRNSDWRHLDNVDVFSMPDTWEYPWYAAWDLAFHCITLCYHRPGLCQAAVDSAVPRVVHAPQRATARV